VRRRAVFSALALLPPWFPLARAQEAKPDVAYVPTPPAVVTRMLQLARVRRSDLVYDLGCGDGRIVIEAARRHGARGVGIDIDPQRIAEARENARHAGVEDKVRFEVADLFQSDFSPATVVMLYLLPQLNERLRPQLWRQLKVGTRVVSHEWEMGDAWPPDRTEVVENRTIHVWTIRVQHKKRA
jgi:ribosomal protein L11 methylase PrmA